MSNSEELKFAGDVKIVKALLTSSTGFSQNIAEQVQAVNFFEDIFSPFITGNLIMKDGLDLINLFPMIGEETLDLEILTPTLDDAKITGKFMVYKVSEREQLGDSLQVYKLSFTSRESLVDMNKKTSKVFSGKIDELIPPFIQDSNFGLESSKRVIIDPNTQYIKYISNFWSPIKNIQFLMKRAIATTGRPDFLFFENRDGFYFVSLGSLKNNPIYQSFTKDNYTREVESTGMSTRDINEDYKKIEQISIPTVLNSMERIRSGALASTQFIYDVTTKRYRVNYFDINNVWESQNHLNEHKPYSSTAIIKNRSKLYTTTDFSDTFTGFEGNDNYNTFQERISTMFLAEDRRVQITVPGRTDYTVGQTVELDLPRLEPFTKGEEDTDDKVLNGKYLVAALNHYVTKERHTCVMELVKDSTVANPNGRFD